MLLGSIGDDFTGSSDLANTLAKGGMRVVQYAGVPDKNADPDIEAGVIALKSRTAPVSDAVRQSLEAFQWLKAQGCTQFLFKYCSTFDSTPGGNIGPVADALIEAVGADRVIVCPAFPATGRSIYQGHLFVNDRLLNESGMENHPLTPMTDADLRRWLAPQTRHRVGHIGFETVSRGMEAIRLALDEERAENRTLIVVDAIQDRDLYEIGSAVAGLPLVTGGSGIALGLPENFRRAGKLSGETPDWSGCPGPAVILSGSCSIATRGQVAHYRADHPTLDIDADAVMAGEMTTDTVSEWLVERIDDMPLATSSADPEKVKVAQSRHGRDAVAQTIERVFSGVARRLVDHGARRLIVAGGETSGAVVTGLKIKAMEIGPEIDPGVPALKLVDPPLALALKSGNFGAVDFFARAARILEGS